MSTEQYATITEYATFIFYKINLIKQAVVLRHTSEINWKKIIDEVQDARAALAKIRILIVQLQEHSNTAQELLNNVEFLKQKMEHALTFTIPEQQVKLAAARLPVVQEQPTSARPQPSLQPAKCADPVSLVQLITTEEFEALPKYMKGRLKYTQVNQALSEFNVTLSSKYKIVHKKRSELSDKDLKKWKEYKAQENEATKGLLFVIEDDLKTFSRWKSDVICKSVVVILRHLGRIKEIRGPGKIVRYAVCN